jgi:hypothetical protein
VFWAALAAFCATECATARILCNSRFEPFAARNRNPTFLAGTIPDSKALLHTAYFSAKGLHGHVACWRSSTDMSGNGTAPLPQPDHSITKVAEGTAAICLDNILTMSVASAENPDQMTAPAFAVTDED